MTVEEAARKLRTTELIVYILSFVIIILAGMVVGTRTHSIWICILLGGILGLSVSRLARFCIELKLDELARLMVDDDELEDEVEKIIKNTKENEKDSSNS